mgnify:CR=1 FL=1
MTGIKGQTRTYPTFLDREPLSSGEEARAREDAEIGSQALRRALDSYFERGGRG